MDPAPADRLPEIFAEALERRPETRVAFLTMACAGDDALLAQARELIAHAGATDRFLEGLAFGAAELVGGDEGELKPGDKLGDYRVDSLLGEGGMGEVYLADDTRLERRVAIKLLKPHLREALGQRFEHERRVLAGLTHPGIATLYNAAQSEGRAYLVMEYVEGDRIDDYCDRRKLPIEGRLIIFRKVCAGVAYAHQHLVIHRDLKPANIRVTPNGEPKLLDFGIAKLIDPLAEQNGGQTVTQHGAMTPEYASPEQLRGEAISTATDIYNLGLLLYELLSGRRPFGKRIHPGDNPGDALWEGTIQRPSTVTVSEAAAAARGTVPARLARQLAGDLDNIVLKAMRPEPARRYLSAAQLSDDILRHLERRPVSARKETLRYSGSRFIARNRALSAAALAILLTLVGGIVGTTWQAHVANEQRRAAEQQRLLAQRRFDDVRRLADSLMFEIHDSVQDLAGSTPTRKLIVNRALEYLDRLSNDADTPDLRRDLATAYRKVGDVQGNPYFANLGDTGGAMTSYRRAEALLQSLVGSEQATASPELGLARGTVTRAIGDIYDAKGDFQDAVLAYRQSLEIIVSLAQAGPTDPKVIDELARAYETLGDGLDRQESGSPEQVHCFEQSLSYRENLAARNPADPNSRRGVSIMRMKLGEATVHDHGRGVALLQAAAESLRQVASENPDNARMRRTYAVALTKLAWAQTETGDLNGALSSQDTTLTIREQTVAADPKDDQAAFDLAITHADLVDTLTQLGRPGEAITHATESIEMLERLMAADPASASYRRACALAYSRLGKAQEALADSQSADTATGQAHWTQARVSYSKARELFAALAAEGVVRKEDTGKVDETTAAITRCEGKIARPGT